ncbi:putative translation initiation factor IF3 [Aspergillus fumigatus Af293]|jgi:translation initiation factor IF-3|uniref:Translation initiation factor IF3, putative n=3 Tax=Aspergillus fumigatus TaxID=746128 RepID=Q4WSN6_ASPFU|nr:translation initiation factor IF3, putative [Aspergillus fumigatus Af293]EAL90546.1 translation initiation factor IF3, putative [Aspergillus fumigatus Af293]EDP56452.1 translation initiation factor IF3, putative [Aspergillus fumigatus A1163]
MAESQGRKVQDGDKTLETMVLDPHAVAVVPHLLWLGFLHASSVWDRPVVGLTTSLWSKALLIYTNRFQLSPLNQKKSFILFIRFVHTNSGYLCYSFASCHRTRFARRPILDMKHIRGLISITQALRLTFLPPFQTTHVQFLRYNNALRGTQLRFLQSSRRLPSQQPRQTQIRDEDIRSEYIQIVNENGDLEPAMKLRDVLRSFDRSENFLVQVSPALPGRPPICKIMNKMAMREHERAKAKAAHATKTAVKQIELNWAIDSHDLAHRLKQLTNFLEKGRRVEIILTRKKGKRAPTVEEIKNVMDSVLQATKEANAMQIKPMEGEPGKHVTLYVKKKDA